VPRSGVLVPSRPATDFLFFTGWNEVLNYESCEAELLVPVLEYLVLLLYRGYQHIAFFVEVLFGITQLGSKVSDLFPVLV